MALDPQKKAEVTSLLGGIIKQVMVIEGRAVSAGQAVAYLENTEIVELQKNYLTTKKEALIADQEYRRQKDLSTQGAGVEKTLQQATANYEITKAQLTGLEKQLRQLSISPEQVSSGNMVTQIPIKTPISGTVSKINISTGSYVDMQTPLMSITDNAGIHCDVKVFEKDINMVRIGQEVDITLGFTEHHSHDYKQVIYKFGGYSEVRGFWMNNYPEDGEFTHEIIIPESDVLAEGYPVRFKEERIEELLGFSKRIWQFPPVRAIQTGLEIEDDSAGLAELAQGGFPNAWPFAIVEDSRACYEDSIYDIQPITEGKKGLLFRRTGADNE